MRRISCGQITASSSPTDIQQHDEDTDDHKRNTNIDCQISGVGLTITENTFKLSLNVIIQIVAIDRCYRAKHD